MKQITFSSNDKKHKEFTATLRKNVNDYFKQRQISSKCNVAMVIKSIIILSLYIVPFGILLTFNINLWQALGFTILLGIAKAGLGMSVMHDAVHGSYSSKKWVNKMMGCSMYLIGSNVFNWKIQHNIFHHAYTNIDGHDEDIQSRWILRFSKHSPIKNIHRFQYIYAYFLYCLMTISMLFGDITQLIMYHKSGLLKKHNANPVFEFSIMILVKVTYLFVAIGLPILFTEFNWWQVIAGFFIMHFVCGFIMTIVFQMAHIVEGAEQPLLDENAATNNEWTIHQILTTSNFAPKNWLLNWYVGGLNYQIEHHLFPNICHIHYKHISPIVEKTAKDFGIPYNMKSTLVEALQSHTKRLKELGDL